MRPEKLDIKKAMLTPKDTFGAPERVLADPRLDREDKRAILKNWEQDARELAVAEEEGMQGGERSMLQRVLLALRAVSDTGEETEGRAKKRRDSQISEKTAVPTEVEPLPLVKDLMLPTDEVVHVDHNLREAYVRGRHYELPFLPVVDGDEIVGVLPARDIHDQALEVEKDIESAVVRDRMSNQVAFCYADDDLQMAKEVLDESGHKFLLVADDQQHLAGLITPEAITAALREHGPRRPPVSEPDSEAAGRVVETPGRAKGGRRGRPKLYAVKPRIKK